MKDRPSVAREHILVLLAYALLSLLLTWPLVAKITTHVPGVAQWAFDESTFIWNIWYLKHALVDNLSSPLHSDLIWYPLGIDLILYTYNFFHALLSQPLMLAANLPLASNVSLLFSTLFSAYGTFLLVRYLIARVRPNADRLSLVAAPFIAGLIYAFASNRAIYAALGHYDMVTTQWIPFYALMLLRMLDGALAARRRRNAALLAGFFFAFSGLAEMIIAVFLAIFTLIVAVDYLARWNEERRAKNEERRTKNEDRGRGFSGDTGQMAAPDLRSSLFNFFWLGLTAFLLWSLVLVPILYQFLADDFSLKGWGEAIPLSTDLLGWFTPTVLHPIFGGDLIAELRRVQLRALELGVSGFRDLNTVFLGWVTLALALIGFFAYRSRVRIWIWTSIIFGLFTLGPFLQINGEYQFDLDGVDATFPLPYALLHYIPVVKANRAPNRNSVLLMLGLAVLAGFGVWWLVGKSRERRAKNEEQRPKSKDRRSAQDATFPIFDLRSLFFVLVLAFLVLFEHLTIPAPLSDARVPGVYGEIAADPDAVSVMQVPLGWRNSFGVYGSERTQLQYYQTAHGKPMLGGNISRAPDFKMGYFQRIPFFQALTTVEFGGQVPPEVQQAASDQAHELMYLYNTEYVLLYPPIPQRFPYADHWEESWAWVKENVPLEEEPFWSQDGIEAYRVVQPEGDDGFTIDLGVAGTFPYLGEGWDDVEVDVPYETPATWALGEESRLFVPLRQVDADVTYQLRARLHPFAYPGSAAQSVTASVNGSLLDEVTLNDGWQEVSWQVPGTILIDGLNRVALGWDHAASPREVIAGSRQIGGTGVDMPVDVDIKAFADGAFMALFDERGEQIDASAGRQGVNVTVLDERNGDVLHAVGFDTAANAFESQALAEFLAQLEDGQIVLIATSGDATAYLEAEAVAQLQRVGVDASLVDLSGNHFAIAGLVGASPGTAATVVDPNEAFLRISLNRDRRPLAAAVDWVEIGQ